LVAYDDKRNSSKKLLLPEWEGGEDCASDGLKDNGVHRPWSVIDIVTIFIAVYALFYKIAKLVFTFINLAASCLILKVRYPFCKQIARTVFLKITRSSVPSCIRRPSYCTVYLLEHYDLLRKCVPRTFLLSPLPPTQISRILST
jgi:hypothetical protein